MSDDSDFRTSVFKAALDKIGGDRTGMEIARAVAAGVMRARELDGVANLMEASAEVGAVEDQMARFECLKLASARMPFDVYSTDGVIAAAKSMADFVLGAAPVAKQSADIGQMTDPHNLDNIHHGSWRVPICGCNLGFGQECGSGLCPHRPKQGLAL